MLDNTAFPEKAVLCRSFDAFGTPYAKGKFKIGQTLVERGFMSTSRLEAKTLPFKQYATMPITLEIHVSPGAKALDVAAYSKYPEQQEVLFARNSLLKVLSHNDNYTYVKVEYVSQKIKKDSALSVEISDVDCLVSDKEFENGMTDEDFARWVYEKATEPDPPGYEPGSRFFGSLADLEIVDESEASGEPFDFTKHPRYEEALTEKREMERQEAEVAKAAAAEE